MTDAAIVTWAAVAVLAGFVIGWVVDPVASHRRGQMGRQRPQEGKHE